jgi:Arc/MetJ family transcription regulator
MKRTNLVLDEKLLADAVRLTGEKTYSGAVNHALRELVRQAQADSIFDLQGSGGWEGDLAEMRGDRPRRGKRR